ncbi:AMP-binding protein [Streptomyces sp. NPDC001594]|uniref:AMP-binding protein n=1 Tax=Streptomyces sp. NPDC001594 TaxID=3364590 RepID=UPI0036C76168
MHLNVSAPGWAKHSWSSFFVPWNAEATVLALHSTTAADAGAVLEVLRTRGVTTFCAPPTTWRAMVSAGLGARPEGLREAVAAGEPMEAALARAVREGWGVDVRGGFGQTETTGLIGAPPGRPPVPGSMGRALPGYRLAVVDPGTGREVPDGEGGELCVDLTERPAGLMRGYADDPRKTARAFAGGYYHTGDLVVRAADGSFTYMARADDMFKSFDHRISPLELERVLLRHPAVADAAVVPVPDPVGLWAAKASRARAPATHGEPDRVNHAGHSQSPTGIRPESAGCELWSRQSRTPGRAQPALTVPLGIMPAWISFSHHRPASARSASVCPGTKPMPRWTRSATLPRSRNQTGQGSTSSARAD